MNDFPEPEDDLPLDDDEPDWRRPEEEVDPQVLARAVLAEMDAARAKRKAERDDDEEEEMAAEYWRDAVAEGLHVSWRHLDATYAKQPKKERLTMRVDEDVLAWFRKRGRGHQTFMNSVLRAFMLASEEAR